MADMKKGNTEVTRVDKEFLKEMKALAKFRYIKNFEKKEPNLAEMMRLLRRTHAWNMAKLELSTKKRRKSLL